MPAARHFSRSEPLEIKSQIERNIGCPKTEMYFDLLSKFLGVKIGRPEFERLLIGTIGRENVHLHNRLLRSVLKSACLSMTAPPNDSNLEGALRVKVLNEHQRSFQSLCRDFPRSPRKGRTLNLGDRRFKDRPSPLGPHGKPFGEFIPRNHEQQSANVLPSLGSRPPGSVEDGEEVDQGAGSPSIHRSPMRAPLGIPVYTRRACKKVTNWFASSSHAETCHHSGELPDTNSLRKRLKQNSETKGINMSSDYANLLNSSLDTYLKRLIKPCLDLAQARSEQIHVGHGRPGLNRILPATYAQKSGGNASGSMLDFRIAMELNPSILGEEWPVLLEKVCLLAGEE